ncbi:MAG: hypothetical protein AAGC46_05505 [Solirubrobacteraceae bacterium]|nr:hypothetical protein [Patulibacter sp.]
MRVRLVLGLSILVAGLLPATAGAQTLISQRYYDAAGNPQAIANIAYVNAPSDPVWRTCTPECGDASPGHTIAPGPTPAGTVFEAQSTADGVVSTARTPAWQGQLTNTAPPVVHGDVRVGGVVWAEGGTWTGGWGDDVHGLRLLACPDATTTTCVPIGNPYLATTTSLPVHPAYVGWYLRAVDTDFGFSPASTAQAITVYPGSTTTSPLQTYAPTAVSGPVGPIPPPQTPTAGKVSGKLFVGQTIAALAGTWPDAPTGGSIATGLRACPTRKDSASCLLLTPIDKPTTSATFKIDPKLVGWYVGAVDNHLWPNPWGPLTTFGDGKLPVAGPTVVDGPLSTVPIGLGFRPRASLRKRAVQHGTHLTLGQLRCAARCVATVTVRRGKAVSTTSVVVTKKTRDVVVRAGAWLSRGNRAPLRVRVAFQGSSVTKTGAVLAPRAAA